MKRDKRLFGLLLAAMLLFSACGGQDPAPLSSEEISSVSESAVQTESYAKLPELTLPALTEPSAETLPVSTEESTAETETAAETETLPAETGTELTETDAETPTETLVETMPPTTVPPTTGSPETVPPTTVPPTTVPPETVPPTTAPPETVPPTTVPPATLPPTTTPVPSGGNGYRICIDPGHQEHANLEQEPIGPGAAETKPKVSAGTQGIQTGTPEYKVTLIVAMQLKSELEKRGYTVIMTRTENNVNISNIERANIANQAGVDAFLRIHCDGSVIESWNGISILAKTQWNPYDNTLADECNQLASDLLTAMCQATGAKNNGVSARDDMSGLNWCKVPSVLIEMGYLTNIAEEQKLLNPEYQAKLVQGMANGLDKYLGR